MSYIIIYFGDKPVFLCDEINKTIEEYIHHPGTVFIDEISTPAINSLLHEIVKDKFNAGILFDKDLNKLKQAFYKHFTIIQAGGGVVLNDKEEILLIYRRGKWDLPKGKLDKNEKIEQCAVREVQEETGITNINLEEKIIITNHTYEEFGKHILKESHWFKMRCSGDQKLIPQTEEDITEVKWISRSDIKKYYTDTFPTIIEVLNKMEK